MRSIWTYGKVQRLIGNLIRDRSAFFRPIAEPVYLDIGPGEHLDPDFYAVDWFWRPGVARCLDLRKGLRLPARSVKGAYSEHCIEHLPVALTQKLLRELHAAMVEGAWVRVSMPDLELYARSYVESLECGQDVTPYPAASKDGVYSPAIPINNVIRLHGHQFVYDFATFGKMLRDVGFRNVTKVDFGYGTDPMLLREQEHRRRESFYVEAQR